MQTNLFGYQQSTGITIEEATQKAHVSTATIRNWIKTNYLKKIGKGMICRASFEYFMQNVVGREKLNARANKLQKTSNNPIIDVQYLIENYDQKDIGEEYENSLSESFRNREGIYYTPEWVVSDMLKNIPIHSHMTFLDPCCGSGNFILQALRFGISPTHVYGFDVDQNAVCITQARIRKEFGVEAPNIRVGNFLDEAKYLENQKFDLIFTNPPWGKKIQKKERQQIAKMYYCGNSYDTTSLFLGASLTLLKENGFLGFLVQEAFFNIASFEYIRQRIITKNILRLVDYDRAFKGLITKAQALIIQNNESENQEIICSVKNIEHKRSTQSFKNNPKCIINFGVTQQEAQVISQLYDYQHITLKNRADWALGIVTGNNQKYCRKTPENEQFIPIYKGSDITKEGLKPATNFVWNDFSNFQQVAPMKMYQASEKLIYRFISSNLCFCYDNEQKMVLNSANLLIPKNIPISIKQLSDLLNSEIINWLFNKLFATHKVLRGDLELLPIHTDFFKKNDEFSEKKYLEYLQIEKNEDGTFRIKN